VNFENSTPLWLYISKEAKVYQMGLKLGEVDARIVTEAFVGLLKGDNNSFTSQKLFLEAMFTILGSIPQQYTFYNCRPLQNCRGKSAKSL